MKVLEKGREQRGWSKECRCTGNGNGGGGCNALLLVVAAVGDAETPFVMERKP